nr:NAD-dependent epimerase/dehydratase family protein [Granulicella arctica]
MKLREEGWIVSTILRDAVKANYASSLGLNVVSLADAQGMLDLAKTTDALLITAAPAEDGCPAYRTLSATVAQNSRLQWLGYLSSTSVYGDQECRWTNEDSTLKACKGPGLARIQAEASWQRLASEHDLRLKLFRLAGIYGPGRSALNRLRKGEARRVVKPGHVVSRIHVDDAAQLLLLSIRRPDVGSIYNVSDLEPASGADVVLYAAWLLGEVAPPEVAFDEASLPAAAARFFIECRRISSDRAQRELEWKPIYLSYREGFRELAKAMVASGQ